MHTANTTSPSPAQQQLDTVLRPFHAAWIGEARCFLEPALDPHADFWTRWSAVRYLSDEFRGRYRLVRDLVEELRPFVRPDVAERLVSEGERVFKLRLEIDRIGRRRGTAAEMAAAIEALLEQLGVWCAEIEFAAGRLASSDLAPEGTDLLADLDAALRALP
ncbi:MAG: hypothetical protein ABIQ49_00175 [Gemmatimonadales bacterium]